MKYKKYFIIASTMLAFACTKKSTVATKENKVNEPHIATIEGEKIPVSEFKYTYEKNNANNEELYSEQDLKDYLDLFINFKLKVKEAESLGYDTILSFQQELAGYKKQLAKPYLQETELLDKYVRQQYNRMKEEVNASHILIKVAPNASPEDTTKAFQKITDIRKKALAGEDFNELAQKYSEDPSAIANKGNLGYFGAMLMVYDFEDAAYKTPKDKISEPVRTQFGYHLIKVHDKIPSRGYVHVAHIMVQASQGIDKEDSIKAAKKIHEIYNKLEDGKQWDEIAAQYSEHTKTAKKGGELGTYRSGENLPEILNAAYELQPGEYSKPVLSPYGWHIVKTIDKKPIPPFEELEKQLTSKVKSSGIAQKSQKDVIAKLKDKYEYELKEDIYNKVMATPDSVFINESASVSKDLSEKAIFTIDGINYPASDFISYLEENKNRLRAPVKDVKEALFEKYSNQKLSDYELEILEEEHPDYRLLVKEYRDGILLFELMDTEIWSKAVQDTVGLKSYYEANKGQFEWKERLEADIYTLEDEGMTEELKKDIQSGLTTDLILEKYNKKSPLNLKVESDTYEKGANKIADQVDWNEGIQEKKDDDMVYLINVKKVLPAGTKKLDEARGMVIAKYQSYLEKEWVSNLRDKYNFEINQEQVKKLITNN